MLSLHQLRTFLEVTRSGSVREAADRLVVSQPAVSSALASLQRELGIPLVERDGRGLRLTVAGERFAAYGRQIFALIDDAIAGTRAAAGGAAVVRLAAVTTAAEQLLPSLLAGFGEQALTAAVELHVANRESVWDRLAHGEADLAIGGRPPDERFLSRAIRANQLVIVAGRAHAIDQAGLGTATWLVREPGSGTRATTEALFEALGITPRTVTIGSNGAILGCVRVGLGVSLLSRDALARDLASGDVVEVATARTPLVRDWHIVALAARPPTIGAQRFVDYVIASGAFTKP